MSDRELLELAAKAAGIEFGLYHEAPSKLVKTQIGDAWVSWNPLADDGDALRLAVKLEMNVEQDPGAVFVSTEKIDFCEHLIEDRVAATRRAIVRAAAEIGRKMP